MMLSDGHIAFRSVTANARFMFVLPTLLFSKNRGSGKMAKREYFNLVLTLMTPYCSAGYIPYIKEWYDSKQGAKLAVYR